MSSRHESALEKAAERLRSMALDQKPDSFLGTEDTLRSAFGISRSTVRQIARVLEREGVLKVRRGLNGGYYSARPDSATIEAAVSTYLRTLKVDPRDATRVASALWMLVVSKAAMACGAHQRTRVHALIDKVDGLPADAPFSWIRDIELESHDVLLSISDSQYIRLIFDVNFGFSRNRLPLAAPMDHTEEHREFVSAWKRAKRSELEAVAAGDAELAPVIAQHARRLWHMRIWQAG